MRFMRNKESSAAATVILCDDEETVRLMLRKALERDGRFSVIGEASTGKEAMQQVDEHRPDALLLDLGMPDTTGVAVLRALRESFPDLKIVVVSGFSAMGDEVVDMGANSFVSKSARAKDVIAALTDSLWAEDLASA